MFSNFLFCVGIITMIVALVGLCLMLGSFKVYKMKLDKKLDAEYGKRRY